MPISGKEMLDKFLKDGWELKRVNGSHHVVEKGNISVSIPVHGNRSLHKGTEQSLLKQGGYKK
jgi:predicted RNA binding protein YcfA (HicA-like mRNA interferase family)